MSEEIEEVEESLGHPPKKVHDNVLELFRKLGESEGDGKFFVKTGVALLRRLSENSMEENGDTELKYAVKRLVRGLGASSDATKQRFYSVLVTLLDIIENIDIKGILEFADRELRTSGGNSKSENADISSGRILLYGAVIRTGTFEKLDRSDKKKLFDNLLTSGKKRDYLYLLAATFIDQLCNNVSESYFKSDLWPSLRSELSKPWDEQSVDTLYLLHVLNDRFPKVVDGKYFAGFLGSKEIVSPKNLDRLANVLINMPRLETANHPAYDLLSKRISERNLSEQFVSEADKLLTKYNYNRHTVFTLILTSIISNLNDVSALPNLITKNYTQQTLIYFKTVRSRKKPEQLQGKIYELFDAIVERLKRENVDSEIKVAVVERLMFDPGNFIFEKITRSKVIQRIISDVDDKGVRLIGDVFKKVILNEQKFLNNDRIYSSRLFVKLLSHNSIRDDITWKIDQMEFLMRLGFTENTSIGIELSKFFRSSFYKCLTLKEKNFEDLRTKLSKLFFALNKLIKNNEIRSNFVSETTRKIWLETHRFIVANFADSESSSESKIKVFETLSLFLGLRIFDDSELVEDCLRELFQCYQRSGKKSPKKGDENDDPDFVDVMVDLFLCLLSYDSASFRSIIGTVFPYFVEFLSDSGFGQILSVLDPENDDILTGKGKFNGDSESSGDDSEEDVDSTSASEDSNSEDSDSEEPPTNQKLKQAVHSVLNQFGDEELDLDEMSESEGKKLDEALSEAFKNNFSKSKLKKKQSKREKLKMNFRIRVLDLMEIFLSEGCPSLGKCLEVTSLLLRLDEFSVRDPTRKPLSDRVRGILRLIGELKRFGNVDDLDPKRYLSEFLMLWDRGDRNAILMQSMRESISNSIIFFIRSSQFIHKSNHKSKDLIEESMVDILIIGLDSYFLKRNSTVTFDTFKSIVKVDFFGLYDLIQNVFSYVYSKNLKIFKKINAIELIEIFLKNHRFLTSNKPNQKFLISLKNFLKTTKRIFEYFSESETAIQNQFLSSILSVLISIKNSPISVDFDFLGLSKSIDKYKKVHKFTNKTKKSYNKLSILIQNDKNKKKSYEDGSSSSSNDDSENFEDKLNLESRIEEEKRRLGIESESKRKNEFPEEKTSKKVRLSNGFKK